MNDRRRPALAFHGMNEADAHAVIGWRYEEPYSFYNLDAESDELLPEMLDGSHYSVRDDGGDLIGFFAVGKTAQLPGAHQAGLYVGSNVLDIGLGLRPDLTGKGGGKAFLEACLSFGRQRFSPRSFRLAVATFNQRAIRLYEHAGFTAVTTFMSDTPKGYVEFLLMTKPR